MKLTFRPILGSLRLLRRRAVETDRPGLALWAGEGERAASDVRRYVAETAHKDEVLDAEAEKEIAAGMQGLADGRVDAEDLAHFQRARRCVKRSGEHAHNLGEVAS